MKKGQGSGWHGESKRHSDARKHGRARPNRAIFGTERTALVGSSNKYVDTLQKYGEAPLEKERRAAEEESKDRELDRKIKLMKAKKGEDDGGDGGLLGMFNGK